MNAQNEKCPAPEQASEAVPQRPKTENPTAEAIFEQAAGAGNLINSKFGFGDGNNRADALTDDQRQALGEAISEYFGKLDSDEGVRAPEGRILRTFDYCDSRNIDDLIDRAIVPVLATSANETGAEGLDGLAHELWSAAQLTPGEGIEDGVRRVAEIRQAQFDCFATEVRFVRRELDIEDSAYLGASVAAIRALKARAAASPAAEDDNSITLDRRDLFDFVRGAIKSTLQDYKAGEGMTPSCYWQEATNRTEAVLEALHTKSPYIEAAPQPAQADAPANARPKCHGCPINPTCPSTSCGTPADARESHTYASTQATNCASCGEHRHTPLRIDWMGGYVCLTCIDRELESRAPADAGEPIGQHDLSTSTGGRAYIAEFFAKRLRRHDFGRYIAEWLAADFACALAQYLSEHDAASRAEPRAELPRFPTMLRKMWSGGEVQRWIDENVAPRAPLTNAMRDVLAERRRHVEQEGWTPEHDDQHTDGAMARAAACYAYPELTAIAGLRTWPWDTTWWMPSAPRRNLVKAVALGIAEIERLDRASASAGEHQ
ncbi:hypothetical protein WL78_00340 [Burkholderia ubonensis]|uniref:hypothetical protein n=1 Tax=Burkholderia ubonensis TaxID=101571 RepID=UPI0007538038|nr:hypothetical protein [Burkholderia ubonensis]KWE77245.1 hypothetical protein WL78_00340 [Burkholderia ubonensis]